MDEDLNQAAQQVLGEKTKSMKTKIDISEALKKPYVNEFEASGISQKAVSTLRNERFLGRGFPYIKIGRKVLYSTADLINALEKSRIYPQR